MVLLEELVYGRSQADRFSFKAMWCSLKNESVVDARWPPMRTMLSEEWLDGSLQNEWVHDRPLAQLPVPYIDTNSALYLTSTGTLI